MEYKETKQDKQEGLKLIEGFLELLPADQKAPTMGFETNTRPEDITLEE